MNVDEAIQINKKNINEKKLLREQEIEAFSNPSKYLEEIYLKFSKSDIPSINYIHPKVSLVDRIAIITELKKRFNVTNMSSKLPGPDLVDDENAPFIIVIKLI